MTANMNRRILLIICGILLMSTFWLPWLRLYQLNIIQGFTAINGMEIIEKLNHYSGSSLRLPMYIGLVNGFYLLPVTGAGLSFSALINHKWGCIIFGMICCGVVNLFWAFSYFAISQDSILIQLFDPLAEIGIGYILICPLSIAGIILSFYFLEK